MIEVDGVKAYTMKEAAEILKLHPRTVHEYILKGRLKAKKIYRWYITEENLKAFLQPDASVKSE